MFSRHTTVRNALLIAAPLALGIAGFGAVSASAEPVADCTVLEAAANSGACNGGRNRLRTRIVTGTPVTLTAMTAATATATCPSDTEITGGGYRATLTSPTAAVLVSGSYPTGNQWQVETTAGSNATGTLTAYAVCASVR